MERRAQQFRISPRFYPIRLIAGPENSSEMTIKVENLGETALWVECGIAVAEGISLSEKKPLKLGRIRIGIINNGESGEGRCRVFSNSETVPGTYGIKLVAYGFSKDGAVAASEEKKTELRCEELG